MSLCPELVVAMGAGVVELDSTFIHYFPYYPLIAYHVCGMPSQYGILNFKNGYLPMLQNLTFCPKFLKHVQM